MKNQEKRFAIVTGASSGIGYEFTKILIQNNFNVLAIADGPRIMECARELSTADCKVTPLKADLSTKEGVMQVCEKLLEFKRPIDLLYLNAGFAVHGNFIENDIEDELKLINLNVTSVVHLAHHIIPQMVQKGDGRVLITSSISALMPGPLFATYAASKAFLLSFSEALHKELEETGVTVTAVMPGPTETEFFIRAHMQNTEVGQSEKDDPREVAQEAFEAAMRGDDSILTGSFKNKFDALQTRFLSEQQKAEKHFGMTKPVNELH